MDVVLYEDSATKNIRSLNYNVTLYKDSGLMYRWGKTKEDDPIMSPTGPEILDLEISVDGCNGTKTENGSGSGPCKFCYKSNTNKPPTNMTLATFKKILSKFPQQNGKFFLQQIAFGITGVQTNPDFIPMMEYARSVGIIPNFTLSGFDLTDEIAEKCARLVGALAVSCYESDKDLCYNTIRKFLDLGVKQTNMHLLYYKDNVDFVKEVFYDIVHDERLRGLNAVVLLGLKQKGRGSKLQYATKEQFDDIVNTAIQLNIPLGFDSCSAGKFNKWLDATELKLDKDSIRQSVEPCESFGLFSSYINVNSEYFPCSFAEGAEGWEEGINVLACSDFIRDIWNSDRVSKAREKSLACNRNCIIYPEIN